ncbi:MAG: hypothetical protein WDO69_16020 [Pseudomonadota bacterium]
MNLRVVFIAFGLTAALGACAGRVQVPGRDQPSDDPAGPTPRGGAGGAEPASPSGASEAAGAVGADAGAGGALPNGGAPDESEGGGGDPLGRAGAGGSCASSQGPFATNVVSYSFGGGQNFNQASGFPQAVFGPPVANDPGAVVSLGNGGWMVLKFAGNAIVDGPGVDFTVFENPLPTFKELGTVAVSDDAEHWTEFPCTAVPDATDFGFCAGVNLVYSSPTNGIDPLDPSASGGDHYDLADVGLTHARYVRITDRVDLTGSAGVFDLDAVAIVHAECP